MSRTIALTLLLTMAASLSAAPPEWANDAVWYQIFPERFRNGDPSNDPDAASLEGTWPYHTPAGWRISPWTSDWYALQPWEKPDGKGFYHHAQLRRYGGDLQGILDQLDYLQHLGVTALYLNPVFDSPSLHKYGATYYHHIDRHFGPDPRGDEQLIAAEDPARPETWTWTAADRLFLKLIAEVHRRRMKILIDGVFNHTGIPFWALQRARKEGPTSRFADWFHINRWDDPTTPVDEFDYRGWVGIKDLPEFNRDEHSLHPEVRQHLHAVVQRWMDPNGDGHPDDGIDGWRLDVAAEVPMSFWVEFRSWVKGYNPNAYLTGEIWWEDYTNFTFRNARPWLDQAFDGVMNYRFGDAVLQFLNHGNGPGIPASRLGEQLDAQYQDYGYSRCLALQNIYGSHDTARIGSAVVNPICRLDHGASVQEHPNYQTRRPNSEEKRIWRQLIAFQFLAPGAPYLYYGDELGMWGADDPDCRKPMIWPDYRFDSERALPSGQKYTPDRVQADTDLLRFYRNWISRRKNHPVLRRGDFRVVFTDDTAGVFAFRRTFEGQSIVAVFNAGDRVARVPRELLEPSVPPTSARTRGVWQTSISVPAHGYRVLAPGDWGNSFPRGGAQ